MREPCDTVKKLDNNCISLQAIIGYFGDKYLDLGTVCAAFSSSLPVMPLPTSLSLNLVSVVLLSLGRPGPIHLDAER